MADYEPKLVHLPGTVLAAEVVLHRTLQKIDRIKAVAVIIQWDDDTFSSDHSSMKMSELCMASFTLTAVVNKTIFGEDK